ncbi:tRNA lysidine(34) synthetase TilS [Bacillus massilinigeriensis]|uniref:tRNA lysidine(34) synthetase TilS n=1 Tax=Bacillus massilionigeriensis TaxID=1805475 RepID=UPI00096AFD4A|nr:tRNA lysidine(34) synthetase TilS [Bacillus massilionigeriensis]
MIDKKVEKFLHYKQFHIENSRILVGVSGGPDSLALLHFLWKHRTQWNLDIFAAHLDHMFRGEESYGEALFVRDFCEERNIPFEMKQVNVPKYMEQTGLSLEIAARNCRYQFFEEVAEKLHIDYLALGHHGDDQVETILMRLTRGSTGKARAGIPFLRPFKSGFIFRPFLCLNRREIEKYCTDNHLDPRRDPSNESLLYSRNRFRHQVLPFLHKENPHVHLHFARFSDELISDEDFLQELTVQEMSKVMKVRSQGKIVISIEEFLKIPMPLQRRGIQLILKYLYKEKPASLSAIHIDQVFLLISNPHPSGILDFPNGLKIVRSYDECHFNVQLQEVQPYCIEISKPGFYLLPNGSKLIMEFVDDIQEDKDLNTLLLKLEGTLPIIVRTRKNGDRMTLKGMNGTKKIKDIFIDKKVPVHERNAWPIVTNHSNEIVWIPGIKKANLPVNGESANRYILLKFIKQ